MFLKLDAGSSTSASGLRYWFDDDASSLKETENLTGQQMLDVSALSDGMHTVHCQIMNADGTSGAPVSSMFLKLDVGSSTSASGLRYWFDDDASSLTEVDALTGQQMLDVSALSDGMHTVHCQIMNADGTSGAPVSSMFLKLDAGSSTSASGLRYWFDDDASSLKETDKLSGLYTFDVSDLQAGLHTLNCQVIDNQGKLSAPVARFFVKNFGDIAEGTNRIIKYQYWLNQNSQAMKTVITENISNPYTLIDLLPLQRENIQSSLFHFEITDNEATIYAKNVFHIRFYDARGYFSDAHHAFVDYSVSEKVEDSAEIKKTQTFARPEENTIKWFTLQACEGDTIAFRSSQALSLQVFSPSGEEIYRTSEAESVKWGGCHTWENGTYYVAVHDVTGSRPDVTLEYMHMDKYDVVDWNVRKVGNGGCSTITFQGNGFKDLYAVDLYNAQGDTIRSIDVGHESDAETSVTFDFTDTELGEYDALFHFTEEDKLVSNVVTVEEAVDIELATDVTFPSTFARSATYTVKITNKGNMTAYAVPIYTWIKSLTQDGIYHIDYDGLDLAGLFDGVNTDSLSAAEIAELKSYSDAAGDDHYFLKFWTEDEEREGDSIFVRSNYFFTNIAPYETKTLRLTIHTKEVDIYAYFTVPEDWPSYNSVYDANGNRRVKAIFRNSSLKEKYCCIRNRVECVANLVADGASIANTVLQYAPDLTTQTIAAVADCVAGAASKVISTAGTIMCDDNSVEKNFWDQIHAALDGVSTTGTLSSCLSQLLPWKKVKAILDAIGNVAGGTGIAFGLGVDIADCAIAFTSKIPGCPPPPPGGGGSNGGKSHDPNDIYGYLSEAGSKFIADSVAKVNYTIEFENDTAFATAAAHTIVIKDTLDSKYFDFTKFMPTGIRIGERETHLEETDVKKNNGVISFVKTIDMRPEINAIAQVDGTFSTQTGIAQWTFQSLDPMTMEPTNDLMQGILPVNHDGTSGIGRVLYEIGVKPGKADGAEIKNRASIVFDANEPILTPIWTNIVDGVCPESTITEIAYKNDSIVTLSIEGSDERSGVWKYDLYVQYGVGSPWMKEGELSADSTQVDYKVHDGLYYGFCVLATDSAGNMEQKELRPEVMCADIHLGDVNSDGEVNSLDASLVMAYYLEEPVSLLLAAADVNEDGEVNTLDATLIIQMYLNSEQKKESAPKLKQLFKIQK